MNDTLLSLVGKPIVDQNGKKIGIIRRAFLVTTHGEKSLRIDATVTDKKAKHLLGDIAPGDFSINP